MDYSKVYGDFHVCDKYGARKGESYDNLQDAIDKIDVLRMLDEDVDGILYEGKFSEGIYNSYKFDNLLRIDIEDGIDIYFRNAYYDKWRTYLGFEYCYGTEIARCIYTIELRNKHYYYYDGVESVENKPKLEFDGIYNLFKQLYKEEYIEEYTTEEYGTCVINDKGILFKDKYLYIDDKKVRLDFISEKIAICYGKE